jgi:hypothetical protein
MIPVSIIGVVALNLIYLSAPLGIVCGIIAARRGNKAWGIPGAVGNALLLVGLVALSIRVATSSVD